jgi:putative tricarboxylic transport membrane protein
MMSADESTGVNERRDENAASGQRVQEHTQPESPGHEESEDTRVASILGDRVVAIAVMVVGIALFIYALGFPQPGQPEDPGTAALPLLISGFLVVLGVMLLFNAELGLFLPEPGTRLRTALMVVAGVVYTFLLTALGFVLATLGFMVAGLLIMGIRSPLRLVLVPIAVTLAVYYLFTAALGVYLPSGAIEGMLP